jgi:hypothetical protein
METKIIKLKTKREVELVGNLLLEIRALAYQKNENRGEHNHFIGYIDGISDVVKILTRITDLD